MARRRLTIKHIDPWSVLKFGSVANVALLAIFLLVAGVAWFIVDRLGVVEQVCGIAIDVGFSRCGINAGNLFRALVLLGLLWVVVQSAVLVFLAFLHNLIADLTGGLIVGVVDDSGAPTGPIPPAVRTSARSDDTAAIARGAPAPAARAAAPQTPRSASEQASVPSPARAPDTPTSDEQAARTAGVRATSGVTGQEPARPRPSTPPTGDDDQLFGDR